MNRFKENLVKELQDVKLSKNRKQIIAGQAQRKVQRKAGGQWTYRIVLATFTIFVIGFSYLLTQQKEQHTTGHQAARLQEDTSSWWSLFESDYVRGILLLGIFIGSTYIVKRFLVKKGYGLPVCIECGESWSEKEARKLYRKNSEIVCPHCGQKQYRTKKSIQIGGVLTMPIPLFIMLQHVFHHYFIGIIFFLVGMLIFYHQLVPYVYKLQEKDPMNEPLW
ncbi:TIGR04104 family putative zinc finger protein [Lysinibacillus irui]|uniref:TIGR04104 family putative zinc finger protein n=1 Tax=Lysinibacillus irui TaxID=2998077 RepID=A0ABU5NNP1_9BACI|nr:TIGR04104 family putative zinc finger protein [Lysinibacillus irui]MEA0555336.1 TIGR04104 family putative zinc finger protein [Lysinibacillus irui]MEA0977656.1 TIGR04104 family putative zinc finger protein [Lysinibacillus irui]MEA1043810.1 TIGR04104 family putative zinc finger protein [Lysinibacillus irui]